MDFRETFYYIIKLIVNSRVYKVFGAFFFSSAVTILSILDADEKTLIILLFMTRVFSMIFGTINGSIKNGFNIRKFLMGGVKFITYVVLLYIAKSLELGMHIGFILEVFFSFMIFEMLLSIIKHAGELNLPVPTGLLKFVQKQEKEFEEKFLGTKTGQLCDKKSENK